jgi:serine/threonine-protein kinase
MLYQMLTGVLPFRGDSMAELMYKIANEEAPDLRVARPDLPESLARVVARALAKKSDLRYQDGDQLALDLKAVIAELTGAAPLARPPSAMPHVAAVPAAPAEKTIAFRQSEAPADDADQTLVMGAGGFAATPLPFAAAGAAVPGYDADQSDAAARQAPLFDKTSVMTKPGAMELPQDGGKTGQEP